MSSAPPRRPASLSPERRALVAKLLAQRGIPAGECIPRRSRRETAPLAAIQEGLWFLEQLHPGTPVYNVPTAMRISGPLDVDALDRALDEIVRRHDILRTRFEAAADGPQQVVAAHSRSPLRVVDLSGLDEVQREAEALRLAGEEARTPFDLSRNPPVRTALLRLAVDQHVLLVDIHHIATDGWSMGVFGRELEALYPAFRRGQAAPLPPLAIQFGDFAAWQHDRLRGRALEEQLAYWRDQLRAPLPVLELPCDRPRPAVQSFGGAHQPLALGPQLSGELRSLAQRLKATPFELLLAAFAALLHQRTSQSEIVIGTPFANRNRTELESLIGYFVNMLPLRTSLSGDPTFPELLDRVRSQAAGAHAHQQLPLTRIVNEVRLRRDSSRNAAFQVSFTLMNPEHVPPIFAFGFGAPAPQEVQIDNVVFTPFGFESGVSKFDMAVLLWNSPSGFSGALEYDTALFDPPRIAELADDFAAFLRALVAAPDSQLGDLCRGIAQSGEQRRAARSSQHKRAWGDKLRQIRRKTVSSGDS